MQLWCIISICILLPSITWAQDGIPLPPLPGEDTNKIPGDLLLEPPPAESVLPGKIELGPTSDPLPDPGPDVPKPNTRISPPVGGGRPVPGIRLKPTLPLEETTVLGGQFHIWGGTKKQRDNLLRDARAMSVTLGSALRQPETFTHKIVIQIREAIAIPQSGEQVWSVLSETLGGFRIELNLAPIGGTVPGPLLERELVKCLLAEMMLRKHKDTDLTGKDAPPPDWLLYGTLELLAYQEKGRLSDTFASIFNMQHGLSIDDIFHADPVGMDSVSMIIYRTSCCGLLLMLLEQNRGHESFTNMLHDLAQNSEDPANAIARNFQNLTLSGNSLGKWWTLQLASMAEPGMDEYLTPSETARHLTESLVLSVPPVPEKGRSKAKHGPKKGLKGLFKKKKTDTGPTVASVATAPPPVAPQVTETCAIIDFSKVMDRSDRAAIFGRCQLTLTTLALRAHPLYRPILEEYQAVLKNLSDGRKQKEAPATLSRLETLRAKLQIDLSAVEDYMDWFETTQSEGRSSAFDDYFRAADELSAPPPPRADPISLYIDAMEREFKP